MKFLSIRLFVPAPIKRKVDGGESDEGHVGSRERESADGRDDESGCAGPRVLKNVLRLNIGEGDSNRKLRAHGSEEKSQDKRVLHDSSHPAASDNGEGVSNLWLREYSSDKESIRFIKGRPNRQRATTGSYFRATRAQHPIKAHTQRKRGNSFLADRETSGEANR